MKRMRNAKIVATLGPASSRSDIIRDLFKAGVDVFRLNFSHGTPADHRARVAILRDLERETGRPIGILADLQGPKLRVGTFVDGTVDLLEGRDFRLELASVSGNASRVQLPHPEIFAALRPGVELLLDDGKLRLGVESCGSDFAETRVLAGGLLSDRKGVNVPGVALPISAPTTKDRSDLELALEMGVDWIALSFVQRPEDIIEARSLIGDRAWIMAKLEKPSAIECLDKIVGLSAAVMVARGDLGVELPAEKVPAIQKRIIRSCRGLGKPVIVATQMLESMVKSPVPTRAEAADVATAVYDGADAVMLSAESASGQYPVQAVAMMDRIIAQVEADPQYRQLIEASDTSLRPGGDVAEAVCCAMRRASALLHPAAITCFTSSGHTSLKAARERPQSPILSLTPDLGVARRLALTWGVHSVHTRDADGLTDLADVSARIAETEGFAAAGQTLVVIAGLPFGTAGTTNLMRIARV